ncbi:MAG: type IV secretion system protein TraC [Holosporaceae bacterium]|jgi:conjugal transfer ATP-binding protein TraC|nr:type IV secretion system protein TraC [Holosporaceae bacterium]
MNLNINSFKLEHIGRKISDIFSGLVDPKEKSLTELEEAHHLSDFLPYQWYDTESELFISDKHIGFVLETSPLVGNSDNMQKELSNIFTQILPEESSIQTMIYADKNIGHILDQYIKARENSSEIMQTLAMRRAKYLSQLAIKSHLSPYVLRDFRCYMSVCINLDGDVDLTIKKVTEIKKQIVATLTIVGVPNKVMNAERLIQFLDGVFNADFSCTDTSDKKWNRLDPIRNQIIAHDTDVIVEDDLLKLRNGKIEIKTFSVVNYPAEWTLYQMSELIGDMFRDTRQFPFPFIMHYGVHIHKQSNDVAKIAMKASMAEKQMYSPIGKYIPNIEREHAELQYAQNCLNKGERLVKTQFNVILFSPKGEMSSAEQTLRTMFSTMLFRVESNLGTQLHSLLTTLPLAWHRDTIASLEEFKKLRTTISVESANLVPQQAEWKGTKTPAMLFGGRKGQVIKFCPFDNTAGNYNVTVVGRSGAGKSVFMQELMASTIGLGGRVFVLDVGRSFEKTCYMLGGQFIEFNKNQRDAGSICLNPFSTLDPKNQEAVEDTLAMLKSVIQTMAAPINGVDDKGAALLEQATNETFKKNRNKTTITDIADSLLSLNDDQARDLGQMLYPYTASGAYGKYFNGESNVNLDNDLIVIELEELKERKDLQSVVVQMMVINITNKMFLGDRKTPFNIVFDEAWDMLRTKQSEVFIETLARRLRKYRGSLVVGTQSVNDFYSCAGAQAAWDNSDWNCFLSQKEESIAQLKNSKRILLDEHKERVITSVKTEQGKYAEVLINGADGYAVGKLLLDPFSGLLFSTKAEDYAAVQELRKQGYEIMEAVEHILQERNHEAF